MLEIFFLESHTFQRTHKKLIIEKLCMLFRRDFFRKIFFRDKKPGLTFRHSANLAAATESSFFSVATMLSTKTTFLIRACAVLIEKVDGNYNVREIFKIVICMILHICISAYLLKIRRDFQRSMLSFRFALDVWWEERKFREKNALPTRISGSFNKLSYLRERLMISFYPILPNITYEAEGKSH